MTQVLRQQTECSTNRGCGAGGTAPGEVPGDAGQESLPKELGFGGLGSRTQAQGEEIKGLRVLEEASPGSWSSGRECHGKRLRAEARKVCQEMMKPFALLGQTIRAKAVVGHRAGGVVGYRKRRA